MKFPEFIKYFDKMLVKILTTYTFNKGPLLFTAFTKFYIFIVGIYFLVPNLYF
jgi:hypothetical protein